MFFEFVDYLIDLLYIFIKANIKYLSARRLKL